MSHVGMMVNWVLSMGSMWILPCLLAEDSFLQVLVSVPAKSILLDTVARLVIPALGS